jgi:hypothetical protein
MMDDGRKYRKYRKYTLTDDGWKYRMRHFDEAFWQDILKEILTRHFYETYWWPLKNIDDLQWPLIWWWINEMVLWQFLMSLVYLMCKIVKNHWYIFIKAKIGHYPYIGLYTDIFLPKLLMCKVYLKSIFLSMITSLKLKNINRFLVGEFCL